MDIRYLGRCPPPPSKQFCPNYSYFILRPVQTLINLTLYYRLGNTVLVHFCADPIWACHCSKFYQLPQASDFTSLYSDAGEPSWYLWEFCCIKCPLFVLYLTNAGGVCHHIAVVFCERQVRNSVWSIICVCSFILSRVLYLPSCKIQWPFCVHVWEREEEEEAGFPLKVRTNRDIFIHFMVTLCGNLAAIQDVSV